MISVAVLWIINEEGEVLLAQRAHHKKQDPSVWGPAVTGKLELGETFGQALVREVQEEIGLKPTDYKPTFLLEKVFDHPDGEQRKFGIYYTRFPKTKTDIIHIDRNEVEGIKWIPLQEVVETMRLNPLELVPSAPSVWTHTFAALRSAGLI